MIARVEHSRLFPRHSAYRKMRRRGELSTVHSHTHIPQNGNRVCVATCARGDQHCAKSHTHTRMATGCALKSPVWGVIGTQPFPAQERADLAIQGQTPGVPLACR